MYIFSRFWYIGCFSLLLFLPIRLMFCNLGSRRVYASCLLILWKLYFIIIHNKLKCLILIYFLSFSISSWWQCNFGLPVQWILSYSSTWFWKNIIWTADLLNAFVFETCISVVKSVYHLIKLYLTYRWKYILKNMLANVV